MIERQPIRLPNAAPCMEPLAFGSSPSVRPAITRISLKACGGRIGTLFVPVHDVTKHVVGARVSGIDRCLPLFTAIAVVGERTVDALPLACGSTAIHSGRSIFVAPTASAARRVLISRSPWLSKPVAFIQAILPEDQRQPVAAPSWLNLATYSVPDVSSCILTSRFAGSYFLSETNL